MFYSLCETTLGIQPSTACAGYKMVESIFCRSNITRLIYHHLQNAVQFLFRAFFKLPSTQQSQQKNLFHQALNVCIGFVYMHQSSSLVILGAQMSQQIWCFSEFCSCIQWLLQKLPLKPKITSNVKTIFSFIIL